MEYSVEFSGLKGEIAFSLRNGRRPALDIPGPDPAVPDVRQGSQND